MNIHKHYHHTEHSVLVWEGLLVLVATFLHICNLALEDKGFLEGIIYLVKQERKDGHFSPGHITQLEKTGHASVSILCCTKIPSVLTHCLGSLPL